MNYLKRLVCIVCFISIISMTSTYVQAHGGASNDYYNTISEYTYSQAYEALEMSSEAHKLYPDDQRFIESLNDRSKVILNWSKGSQLNGKYDGAINGYNKILKTDGIDQIIKDEANICLILAKRGEEGIPNRLKQPEYFDLVKKYQQGYMSSHYDYVTLGDYDTFGNYLLIENNSSYSNPDEIQFDEEGIPMVNYSGEFFYNPINIEQYALVLYDKYIKEPQASNKETKDKFIKVSDWLVNRVDTLGALRYPFGYKHYLDDGEFKTGWVSAMAQGQALSVFARAYHLTGDKKYIDAGNSAFRYLTIKTCDDGVTDNLGSLNKSLSNYTFFQLYVTNPSSYTLNGHMFTLIGLYDWSNVENNKDNSLKAKGYFEEGIKTLKYILPYYDIGGFVTYDLGYLTKPGMEPTVNFDYYGIHLTLLDALYRVTKDEDLRYYRILWTSYVVKS